MMISEVRVAEEVFELSCIETGPGTPRWCICRIRVVIILLPHHKHARLHVDFAEASNAAGEL